MVSLPIVCDGKLLPLVDLVSLPGLPRISPAYDARTRERKTWLRETFTHRFPRVRVMPFIYEIPGLNEKTTLTWDHILNKSLDLLYALEARRIEPQYQRLPLIFVCHSFGGLILKKAIQIARTTDERWLRIFETIRGIIFIGCLHDERGQGFDDCCIRCAAVELGFTSGRAAYLNELQTPAGCKAVQEIQAWFRDLRVDFPVLSYYEDKPTKWRVRNFRPDEVGDLCPERLSKLDFDQADCEPVSMDHFQLTSFPQRTDGFYHRLTNAVQSMVSRCTVEDVSLIPSSAELFVQLNRPRTLGEGSSLDLLSESEAPLTPDPLPELRELEVSFGNTPCFMLGEHFENGDFVGRTETLEELAQTLFPSQKKSRHQATFALCGLGGIGKTQIAVKFAYRGRSSSEYRAILFANADTRSKLAQSYFDFAVQLGITDASSSDQNEAREALKTWFETTSEDWLIVFDNADSDDNLQLLAEFRPMTDTGSILITSRDKRLTDRFGGQQVDSLNDKMAVELLWTLTKRSVKEVSATHDSEKKAALSIVKKLDCYPLAIITAANEIINDQCKLTEFEEAFSVKNMIEEAKDMPLRGADNDQYVHSLLTVWNINFQRLHDDERDLLFLIAFLDPDNIPATLLAKGAVQSSQPALEFLNSSRKFIRRRGPILQSSFATHNIGSDGLRMHRLVRAICHVKMTASERQLAFTRAVMVVHNAWPVPERHFRHRPDLWEIQQKYLPHVQSLSDFYASSYDSKSDGNSPLLEAGMEFSDLLYQAAWFLYERGLFKESYPLLDMAQSCCQATNDAEAILSDIHYARAALHTETNAAQEAYDEFKLAFDYIQKALDKGLLDRPNVREALAHGGLGNGLHGLKRFVEAETQYRKCIDLWRDCPGQPIIYITHLATCLWLQDRTTEAEEQLDKVIVDRNDATTYRTGQAMSTLGNVQISQAYDLLAQGHDKAGAEKFEEAYRTHVKTLELYRATLKDRHHRTADAFHKYGWHLHRQMKYPQAIEQLRKALAIYHLEDSGFYQHEIARSKYKLGCILQDSGQEMEGRKELVDAEEMRRSILGSEWSPARSEDDYDDLVFFWTR